MDTYNNFAELRQNEAEGVDYKIICLSRRTETVIIAPHGGCIEPGTLEIARTIAGEDHSLYCFKGLPSRPNCKKRLHITSHKFDEPIALKIVGAASRVVAIHGRGDTFGDESIWMGGLDRRLKEAIAKVCEQAGFPTLLEGHKYEARNAENICNRGRTSAGVQLEIPFATRALLTRDNVQMDKFSTAVRTAIAMP